MSQSQFIFWLNADVKEQFESVCNQIGFDAVAVLNGFVTLVSRDKCLPFDLEDTFVPDDHLFYSEKNLAVLRQAKEELDSGKGVAHELIETDE